MCDTGAVSEATFRSRSIVSLGIGMTSGAFRGRLKGLVRSLHVVGICVLALCRLFEAALAVAQMLTVHGY